MKGYKQVSDACDTPPPTRRIHPNPARPTAWYNWGMARGLAFPIAAALLAGLAPMDTSIAQSPAAVDSLVTHVRTLVDQRQWDVLIDQLPAHIEDARARGDSLTLGRMVCAQGQAFLGVGRVADSRMKLDAAARLSEANADTLTWLTALGVTALALNSQGQSNDALGVIERQRHLATAARDSTGMAFAALGEGYTCLNLGRLERALDAYSDAIPLFGALGVTEWRITALVGKGIALKGLGQWQASRDINYEVRDIARETGDLRNESDAINNLATLEYVHGDLAVAATLYEEAYRIKVAGPDPVDIAAVASNLAELKMELGQFDEAVTILEETRRRCRDLGSEKEYFVVTVTLAQVQDTRGRPAAAESLFREVLSRASSKRVVDKAALGLTRMHVAAGAFDEALAVISEYATELGRDAGGPLIRMNLLEVITLRQLGRVNEALALAERMDDAIDAPRMRPLVLAERAQCESALGRDDNARALVVEVVETLEVEREHTESFTWREIFAGGVYPRLCDAVAAAFTNSGDQAEQAFDLIQRIKGRTLLERIARPGRPITGAFEPVTLREAQTQLESDDLLLDFNVGLYETVMFVVSTNSVRLVSLPGSRSMFAEQVGLFCSLVGSRGGTEQIEAIERSREVVRDGILQELSGQMQDVRRVIVCPDGYLSAVPFDLLLERGQDTLPPDICYLPSPALLNIDRPGASPTGAVALAAIDSDLAGATAEIGDLNREFDGVSVVKGLAPDLAALLSDKELIHVAAHVDVDNARPWHSGIRLGAAAGTADDRPQATHLWASDVVELPLQARLAVLAACESARGLATGGQGVLGLSTAFMVGGVSTVIATLWKVDDATTRELMRRFYRGIARGDSPAAALQLAKQAVREDQHTRHPYYWAGFALIGHGDVPLAIEARQTTSLYIYLLVIGLGIVAVFVWRKIRAV